MAGQILAARSVHASSFSAPRSAGHACNHGSRLQHAAGSPRRNRAQTGCAAGLSKLGRARDGVPVARSPAAFGPASRPAAAGGCRGLHPDQDPRARETARAVPDRHRGEGRDEGQAAARARRPLLGGPVPGPALPSAASRTCRPGRVRCRGAIARGRRRRHGQRLYLAGASAIGAATNAAVVAIPMSSSLMLVTTPPSAVLRCEQLLAAGRRRL